MLLYGKKVHKPSAYPDNPVFDKIFTEVSDLLNLDDFNKENYTCLQTLYETGNDFIPFHRDVERSVDPDGLIK